MNRRSWFLLVLIAVAACNRAPEPPPTTTTAPQRAATGETRPVSGPVPDIDGDNLLNLAYGAALVSRTGEQNLESSAVHAMDGLSFTAWSSSPGGPGQTLVFALGGPSRIEQLGVTTTMKNQSPAKVRFAASSNGRSWREITTIEPSDKGTTMKEVAPFEARYLRVETIEPAEYYAALVSVHAIGAELRPGARHSFGGCWSINTFDATLVQRGTRITGIVGGPTQPTYVDGGIEGRVAKLMWMRGPMWGHAAATLTPDGRNISAITFHEEPIVQHVGQAWIGNRCEGAGTTNAPASSRAPSDFLRRTGHWTMSGLIFDAQDRLIEEPSRDAIDAAAALINAAPAQRFRIVAREFRHHDPGQNLRGTKARVDALRSALRTRNVDLSRVEFIGTGSEHQQHEMPSAIQRMLWSRIDLELD